MSLTVISYQLSVISLLVVIFVVLVLLYFALLRVEKKRSKEILKEHFDEHIKYINKELKKEYDESHK